MDINEFIAKYPKFIIDHSLKDIYENDIKSLIMDVYREKMMIIWHYMVKLYSDIVYYKISEISFEELSNTITTAKQVAEDNTIIFKQAEINHINEGVWRFIYAEFLDDGYEIPFELPEFLSTLDKVIAWRDSIN